MIDREWEQWAKRETPRVEMWAHDYDPNCNGCRTEYKTEREYTSSHTCANPDRHRRLVPRPFDPHFTVVPGTGLNVHLLTLPQLPPDRWDVEREAKRTRHMLDSFGVHTTPSEVRSVSSSSTVPKRRSKKASHR